MRSNAKKPPAVTGGFSRSSADLDGQDEMTHANAKVLSIARDEPANPGSTAWKWRGADFVHVGPGRYTATCLRTHGPEWVKAYRRYSFRLIFLLLSEDVEVTMFINFGSTPQPPKSIASRYYQSWTVANGEAPRRQQPITPDVFLEAGLLYEIEVEDASIDPTTKKEDRPECLVYSRVKRIVRVTRP